MFDVNKLEKEDLIEYIKKLDDVIKHKDSYIDCLEEKVQRMEELSALDVMIFDQQRALRASVIRLDRFEKSHTVNVNVIDLNEDEETNKVKQPKFKIGDIVECSFLNGKYIVYDYDDATIYRIRNVENNNEYTAKAVALTKIPEEE